jgi:hygromycin-B 4-O-kinase
MSAVKPPLDPVTVSAFLHRHLGAPVADVRRLRGGEICTAFAYAVAGERYVVRFGADAGGFLHDRHAHEQFAPSSIPIPRIHETGRFGEYAYAISPQAPGSTIWHLPVEAQEAVVPALIEMLDCIHQIDISGTTGYGYVDNAGVGQYARWVDYLRSIAEEDPGDFYGRWHRLFDESFLERAIYERLLEQMGALLQYCPEERSLVHGDFGFDNVIVEDGRITAVLDWANMKYGDFLFDVAWLTFWPSPVRYADMFRRFYAERGRAVLHYEERLRCYACYIGMDALRFFAHTGQREPYAWARDRALALLDGSPRT